MKFSEMPYQRPNLDEIKAQFAAVTQRFAAAPDYAAAKAAFLDEQTLNKHVDTLANLASIRNTIDTRDEFYDDEMNFWNAAGIVSVKKTTSPFHNSISFSDTACHN